MKRSILFTLLIPFFLCANLATAQWTDVSIPSNWALDKGSFVDDNHGYLTSANYNYLFRTTNGGAVWDSVIIPSGAIDVDFISIDTGFVLINIFSNFSVATTYDRGNSWTTDTLPAGDNYQMMRFTSATEGYVTSIFGSVYRTINGGQNWTPLPMGGYSSANDKEYTGADTIIFTGWDGTFGYQGSVISSVNGGTSFQDQPFNVQYTTFNGTHFLNGANGFAVFTMGWSNFDNYLVHTSNGGTTWDTIIIDTNSTINFRDVFMTSQTEGYIVNQTGATGNILKVNGATTTNEYTSSNMLTRLYKAGSKLFAIGEGGKVVKRDLPPMGIIPTISPLIGLYPNPTSGLLNIPVLSQSLVSIIDMNGKTVMEKNILPGEQIILPLVSNGFYTVRVNNQEGISSAKFLLAR